MQQFQGFNKEERTYVYYKKIFRSFEECIEKLKQKFIAKYSLF